MYIYIYIIHTCYFSSAPFVANELHLLTQVAYVKIEIEKNMQLLLSFPGP